MRSPFSVWWRVGGCFNVSYFVTEREARSFINAHANGTIEFSLCDDEAGVIVRSRFPVLMVA